MKVHFMHILWVCEECDDNNKILGNENLKLPTRRCNNSPFSSSTRLMIWNIKLKQDT